MGMDENSATKFIIELTEDLQEKLFDYSRGNGIPAEQFPELRMIKLKAKVKTIKDILSKIDAWQKNKK